MSNANDGGPAFPSHGTMGEVAHEGISIRDYFAAKAMQAMLSDSEAMNAVSSGAKGMAEIDFALAKMAYVFADAMLKERGHE